MLAEPPHDHEDDLKREIGRLGRLLEGEDHEDGRGGLIGAQQRLTEQFAKLDKRLTIFLSFGVGAFASSGLISKGAEALLKAITGG